MRDITLDEFLAERNRALQTLDMEYVRKTIPHMRFMRDEVVLLALHKARYECTAISDLQRIESREWLKAHGYKRMYGEDFTDELPK